MFEKIKKIYKTPLIQSLHDVRNLGLVVFCILALLVTWSGVKVVQTNYDLQKQMSRMRQENDVKRLANSNLALKNQYLDTDQYLELTARRLYNKAAPGEKLLIVPEEVALAHTKDLPMPISDEEQKALEDVGPWYERNFNAWIEFLFRRPG